jgi:uncharacterized NAD-dependent epimerase/dehydratase family protein
MFCAAFISACASCPQCRQWNTDPDAIFRTAYPAGYTVDIVSGGHGQFFETPNIETLAEAIGRRLDGHRQVNKKAGNLPALPEGQ